MRQLNVLLLTLMLTAAACFGGDKPVKADPPTEVPLSEMDALKLENLALRQRLDLETLQRMQAEAGVLQARIKQETTEVDAATEAAIKAAGFEPGKAVVDLPARKVRKQ